MLFLTCTEHTSTMSPELMKLRIMTISIKTMVLFIIWNFRDDVCRIESQKAVKCVPFAINICIYVKCSSSHAQNTLQPCHLS